MELQSRKKKQSLLVFIDQQKVDEGGDTMTTEYSNPNPNDLSLIQKNKKKSRAMKMQMFIAYRDNTKETNMQIKVDNLINDYWEIRQHNEIVIDQDINQQLERLNQRLEKRSRLCHNIQKLERQSNISGLKVIQNISDWEESKISSILSTSLNGIDYIIYTLQHL